jgi:hypothetical protein
MREQQQLHPWQQQTGPGLAGGTGTGLQLQVLLLGLTLLLLLLELLVRQQQLSPRVRP